MAAMLAQFIVDQSGQSAVDDGTTATLEANLLTAIRAVGRQATILTDTGTANTYVAANTPALTALPATGYSQRVNIANANTGASTYAPDGLAAKPIYGLALQPLQGGELPAGIAVMMYLVQAGVNGGNGAWILIESLGGASQITSATKSQHAVNAGQLQTGALAFATDTGTANTYVCAFTPAITARIEGQVLRFKVKTANTGASTFNDGLGVVALVGGAHSALQGGELVANGDAWVQWNTSVGGGSYILLFCTGAAEQVAPATQSNHAINLAEFAGLFSSSGYMKFPAIVGGVKRTLIFQWVTQASVGTGGLVTSFPIAFPTAVIVEWAAISVTAGPLTQYAAVVSPPSLTSIQTVVNTGNTAVAAFALGY